MKKLPTKTGTTDLGVLLRTTRTGFHYSGKHKAFIRMSWVGDEEELVNVEIYAAHEIMEVTRNEGRFIRKEYIVWWDLPERAGQILSLLPLPCELGCNCYTLNMEGKLVK